ncbi:hypothetical protein C8Q75DRAFT_807944 [Abortiporus biennis]|nr:hypothetical protein C8Q75DRAFT_807944 [Abortiporus biennis]
MQLKGREVNRRVSEYLEMVAHHLQQPEDWLPEKLIQEASSQQHALDQLSSKLIEELKKQSEANIDSPLYQYKAILERKMGHIISASLSGREKHYHTREASARTVVDDILRYMFTSDGEVTSAFIKAEEMIRMPANKMASLVFQNLNVENEEEKEEEEEEKEEEKEKEDEEKEEDDEEKKKKREEEKEKKREAERKRRKRERLFAQLDPVLTELAKSTAETQDVLMQNARRNYSRTTKHSHSQQSKAAWRELVSNSVFSSNQYFAIHSNETMSLTDMCIRVAIGEPLRAKCDVIGETKIDDALKDLSSVQREKFIKDATFEENPEYYTGSVPVNEVAKVRKADNKVKEIKFEEGNDWKFTGFGNDHIRKAKIVKNNAYFNRYLDGKISDGASNKLVAEWERYRQFRREDLVLPVLINEDKRESEDENQVANQCTMNCVAAVTYLHEVIGIADFPVWGVYVRGVEARVVMVWMSSGNVVEDDEAKDGQTKGSQNEEIENSKNDPEIYVLTTNTLCFRLQDPVDAINFAIFILRIRKEVSEKLKEEFEKVKGTFLKKFEDDKSQFTWTHLHQLNEMQNCGNEYITTYAANRIKAFEAEKKKEESEA